MSIDEGNTAAQLGLLPPHQREHQRELKNRRLGEHTILHHACLVWFGLGKQGLLIPSHEARTGLALDCQGNSGRLVPLRKTSANAVLCADTPAATHQKGTPGAQGIFALPGKFPRFPTDSSFPSKGAILECPWDPNTQCSRRSVVGGLDATRGQACWRSEQSTAP